MSRRKTRNLWHDTFDIAATVCTGGLWLLWKTILEDE